MLGESYEMGGGDGGVMMIYDILPGQVNLYDATCHCAMMIICSRIRDVHCGGKNNMRG